MKKEGEKKNMIKLPDVTLIALTSVDIDAHRKALDFSSKEIEFGEVILVIDETIRSIDDWNRAVVYELGKYVKTKFAMLIHADGFIVNSSAWKDEWLNYDYIGAPWPLPVDGYSYRDVYGNIQRVGNSVSLRSKKLLDLPKELNLEWKPYYGNTNEDGFLAVHNRHILEEHGCKFAPFETALNFGRETELPENKNIKPFSFHRYEGGNSGYPRFAKVRNETVATSLPPVGVA